MINFGPTLNLLGGFQDPIQFDYIDLFLNGLRSPTRRWFCNIHRYSSPKLKRFFFQFLLFLPWPKQKNIDTEPRPPGLRAGASAKVVTILGGSGWGRKQRKTQRFFAKHRLQPYGLPMDGWLGGGDVQFFFLYFFGPFLIFCWRCVHPKSRFGVQICSPILTLDLNSYVSPVICRFNHPKSTGFGS